MLKKTFFLFLLLASSHAYAAQNSAPTMADIQDLIKQGNINAAITELQVLLKAQPEHYQAWFLLGVNQAEQQQFDAAISAFHQVVALQPKLAEPHNNLAVIYDEMGNIKAAVNELEASLVLKPGYATAQENLGDLYIKLAADAYQKVLARSDNPTLQRRYQRLLQLPTDSTNGKLPIVKTAKKTPTPATSPAPAPIETAIAKPAVSRPVAPTQPAESQASDASSQQVLNALEAWRSAWSNRNTVAYFAAYSDDFQYGQAYGSLLKWKDYKAWAIQKRSFITIDIEHIASTVMDETLVKLTFLQHFRSDSFNSDDNKEMLFKKTTNGWKIIYEVSM